MTAPSSHRAHMAVLIAGFLGLAGGAALIVNASISVDHALERARHQGRLAVAQGIAFVDQPALGAAEAERAHLAARRAAYHQAAAAERNRGLGVLLALAGLVTATTGYVLDHLQRNVADLEAMRAFE